MPLPPLSKLDGEILDGAWYVHLRRARCEGDIIASVREFLGSLSANELSRLPIRCLEVNSADDIQRLSNMLAGAHEAMAPQAQERVIYLRTVSLLCYATDRLSQVPVQAIETWEAGT